MAQRIIRRARDPVLFAVAKEVSSINTGVLRLIDDLVETMRAYQGLGLAAPQVGILKRVIVAELGSELYELVNPVIINEEGEIIDIEGCLSYPGVWAEVSRPEKIEVSAQNRHGESITVKAEGVLARALRHEIDHLNGEVFVDRVIRYIDPEELEEYGGADAPIRAVIEYSRGEAKV